MRIASVCRLPLTARASSGAKNTSLPLVASWLGSSHYSAQLHSVMPFLGQLSGRPTIFVRIEDAHLRIWRFRDVVIVRILESRYGTQSRSGLS